MHTLIDSPIGPLFAEASARGLRRLDFTDDRLPLTASKLPPIAPAEDREASAILDDLREQLDAYFAGARRDFDLPLDNGGTPFQRRVWQAIASIPFGATATYAEVALSAGNPNAYRAAGTACGANPVAIVVPCHRVVGTDRGLHGFGGGLDTKTWLLRHEGSLAALEQSRREPVGTARRQ